MGFSGGGGGSSTLGGDTDVALSNPNNGQVLTYNSTLGKWQNANSAAGFADPTTTKGDLIIHGSSTTRLAIGSDAQVLTADSTQTNGVKWATPSPGGVTSVAGRSGAVTLGEADIANLTADLAVTEKSANKGAASGYAGLDNGSLLPLANIPAGSSLTVAKTSGNWPARPTARNDVVVYWKGPDPSPSIVSSGTGGMLDNVDIRFITP